jgi:hypothetical protein
MMASVAPTRREHFRTVPIILRLLWSASPSLALSQTIPRSFGHRHRKFHRSCGHCLHATLSLPPILSGWSSTEVSIIMATECDSARRTQRSGASPTTLNTARSSWPRFHMSESPIHPMSRTGGGADASLVLANVLGALPPVGYLER